MALLSRIIGSRLVRYGFVVVAVVGGGYAIAGGLAQDRPGPGEIGLPVSLAALAITLAALLASMWAWRVLLAGLGSPLKFSAAARVMFVGQLGKYLPGSVWPVLVQMEMGTAYQVPRSRAASAGLINMPVSVLSAFLAALVTLPFTGGFDQLPVVHRRNPGVPGLPAPEGAELPARPHVQADQATAA